MASDFNSAAAEIDIILVAQAFLNFYANITLRV
jgi:hypothetical protein